MSETPEMKEDETVEIQWRQITLPDGRYMIFYTFDDEGGCNEQESEQREDV